MATENVNNLIINYLTDKQYEQALANDLINDNELYCTPDISEGGENTGAGAVIIGFTDSDEVIKEKLQSAVSAFYDDVNDNTVRLAKVILYEYPDYGGYDYLIGGYVEGTDLENFFITFGKNDGIKIYSATIEIADGIVNDSGITEEFISATNEKIAELETRIAELEAGGIDLAVNPTDTTNRNIWIETE